MSHDPYSILGLTPGRYDPAVLRRRFQDRQAELRADPRRSPSSIARLDELRIAYAVLADPDKQTIYLKRLERPADTDRCDELRALIAASLEDGLLRHSRRTRILQEGRQLGLSPFHTQLLIAQTQFGPKQVLSTDDVSEPNDARPPSAALARLAGLCLLALALFLAAVRALGV